MKQTGKQLTVMRLLTGIILISILILAAAGCKPSKTDASSGVKSKTKSSLVSEPEESEQESEISEVESEVSESSTPSKNSTASTRSVKGDADTTAKNLGGYTFTFIGMWTAPVQLAPVKGKDALNDAYYERNERLKKEYGFNIKTETMGSDINSFVMQKVLSGANPADILNAEYSKTRTWMMSDILEPFSTGMPNVNLSNTSKWATAAGKHMSRNGKAYGVGSDSIADGEVMFFNSTLLKELNLTSPYDLYDKNNWTWAEFEKLLQKTTRDTNGDQTPDIYGLGYTSWATMHFEAPFSMTNGLNVVSYDSKGKGVFNGTSSNVLEALEFVQGLKDQKLITPNIPSDNPSTTKAFSERKFAFMIHQRAVLSNEYLLNMKDNFGVVPLPRGPRATNYTYISTQMPSYVTTPACPDPDKASFIFNLLMDPLPATGNPRIDDPDYAIKYLQLRDTKSFQIIKALQANMEPNNLYFTITSMWNDSVKKIAAGSTTPKSAMESIKDSAGQVLEDQYQKSIE